MKSLDADLLEQIAHAWGLAPITQHWPASHGIENRNFFLTVATAGAIREYVLTLMTNPPSAGSALVPLLETCAGLGLPVAAPVRSVAGAAVVELDHAPAMLAPRLPGRHVLNPTTAQLAALGRFVARLHRGLGSVEPTLPAYPRGPDWLASRLPECLPFLCYPAQRRMRDAYAAVTDLLGRGDVADLPTGAIHGDLFRDNVLFNAWGLSGVLDFHHAARGFRIYDLAVIVNDWCVDPDRGVLPARLDALLRAYHSIRPLAPAERWFLPVFALYAALAFWQSRLVVALEQRRGRAARANDPGVFERIVGLHLRQPILIDPWWFDQNVAASER